MAITTSPVQKGIDKVSNLNSSSLNLKSLSPNRSSSHQTPIRVSAQVFIARYLRRRRLRAVGE